jgi:cell division protease FtsH
VNNFYRNLALWLTIGLVVILLFNLFTPPISSKQEIVFSDFLDLVEKGEVAEVSIQENNLTGVFHNGKLFKTYAPEDPTLIGQLRKENVRIIAKPTDEGSWYLNLLVSWFPFLLFIGVWIYLMRQMQGGGGRALSFGKSRARLMPDDPKKKVTFDNVAGADEAKEELQEIIEFLKDPKKFQKLGGRIPKGVLLIGPPGTGKTLLAKAISGEAEVPFFNISGSDFVEMFVGVGASRVRDLFEQGKKNAPCLIFVDEIDAVGRHRGAGLGGGHDEREQTLNQLLVELDGFETNEGVIIIAATNRPDVLDPALLRPGRFDRQVVVSRPDIKGREGILEVHSKNIPIDKDVDLAVLARGTPGFSGADLANLVNEAALLAARQMKERVAMNDFEMAKDKVLMGAERRSLIISDKEKKNTAFHEAGHALVAALIPGSDPVHKVTIIPRGQSLGLTQRLPVDERYNHYRTQSLNDIAICLGGRVAEEMVFNEMSSGASNDIDKATYLARKMVCDWGMSEKLGPVNFGKREEHIFLGRDIGNQQEISEKTSIIIDEEIKKFVMEGFNKAKQLIQTHLDQLHALADALLEKEVLDGEDVLKIIKSFPSSPVSKQPLRVSN